MNYFLFLFITTSQGEEKTVLKRFSSAFRRGVYFTNVRRIIHRKGGEIESAVTFDSNYNQKILFGDPKKYEGMWLLNCGFHNDVIEVLSKNTLKCASLAQACLVLLKKEITHSKQRLRLKYANVTNENIGMVSFKKGIYSMLSS